MESINYGVLCPSNLDIINALCALFATYGIVTQAGEFMTVSGCGLYAVALVLTPPPCALGWLHVVQASVSMQRAAVFLVEDSEERSSSSCGCL